MICTMHKSPVIINGRPARSVKGICANPKCGMEVYESLFVLDDSFNVWWGRCPYCGAINALDLSKGIRGYHSHAMYLCLPTNEEVIMNDFLPPDTITSGWQNPENEGKTKEELIKIYG